jgi:hypothetical protein
MDKASADASSGPSAEDPSAGRTSEADRSSEENLSADNSSAEKTSRPPLEQRRQAAHTKQLDLRSLGLLVAIIIGLTLAFGTFTTFIGPVQSAVTLALALAISDADRLLRYLDWEETELRDWAVVGGGALAAGAIYYATLSVMG